MKNSCKYIKLGDICEKITKGTTPSTYGYPFISSGVNYIKAESITKEGRINPSSFVYISEEAHQKLKRSQIKLNDVLFTMAGIFLGKVAILKDKSMLPANTNQAVAIIRISYRCANPFYVYYFLQQDSITRYVNSSTGQSAQPNINLNEISNLRIRLPSIDIQNCIVNILRSLDDKIELNNKINRNLEAQAQAIFKSWFIDFEPFKNGKFIDSELGKIPEGWKVESIYSISEVIYGAPFSSNLFNNKQLGTPIIRIRDLPNEASNTYTTESHPKGYLIKQGDIVVGMDGEFKAYLWGGDNAWLNQRICVFKSKLNVSTAFVMFSIVPLLNEVESSELATTVIHLGKNDIDRFKIILPKLNILKEFNRISIPIFDAIIKNKRESQRLAQLRDTLLPKLMSGEVNISDFIG